MDFTYRKAAQEDVPLLAENDIKRSLEQGNKWDKGMLEELKEMRTEQFTRLILKNTLVFYLAFDGNIFAGMGGLYIWKGNLIQKTSTLSHIYTITQYRQRGAAHQIVSLLIQTAKAQKCKSIEAIVDIETAVEEKQRSFLKEFGFHNVYDEDNVSELSDIMEMKFPARRFLKSISQSLSKS